MPTETTIPRKGNRFGALSTGRPIIFGGPSYKSRRYERNAFDYRFKLDVINHVALNSITAAMQKYFPDIPLQCNREPPRGASTIVYCGKNL